MHLYYSSDCKSEHIQPPDAMNTRLLNPNILRSYVGITNLAQAASTLIEFLIRNPQVLEELIMSRYEESDFLQIAFSAIPSIFGYFASQEMVDLAYIFYVHVTQNSKVNIATRLLMPFFNSGLSCQFISFVMHKFFLLYTPDSQIIDGDAFQIIVSEYAATLIRFCAENLYLLSNELVYILQLIVERNWSDSSLIEIFFDRFVFPHMRVWARKIISKGKWELLEEILKNVKNCTNEIKHLRDSILATTGMFSLPYFNCGGDYKPFRHLVCVNDIVLLGCALYNIQLMPKDIFINDFLEISEKKKFAWFWTDVYLKKQSILQANLFSKNDEYGLLYDKVIDLKFDIDRFENFKEILDKHILNAMDLTAHRVVIAIPQKELHTVGTIYRKYDFLFKSDTFKQLFFLATIRNVASRIPSRYIKKVVEIGHLWLPFMSRAHTLLRLPNFDTLVANFRTSSQICLLTAMRCFRMIDFVPLSVQFFLIIRALKHIDHVATYELTGDSLYPLLFERMESEVFLTSFILLSTFAMKNDIFASLIHPKVMELWMKCDTVIMNFLAFDSEFLDKVSDISQELFEYACPPPDIRRAESAPLIGYY